MHISVGKMEGEVVNDALKRTVLFAAHCWRRSHAVGCWARPSLQHRLLWLKTNRIIPPSARFCRFGGWLICSTFGGVLEVLSGFVLVT